MSFRINTPIGKVFQKITSFFCVINASTYNVMPPNTRILTLDENILFYKLYLQSQGHLNFEY